MTIDQIFPRRRRKDLNCYHSHHVPHHDDQLNMWEYLCQIGMIRAPPNIKTATSSLYKLLNKAPGTVTAGGESGFSSGGAKEGNEGRRVS